MAVADIDGDGIPDLIIADQCGSGYPCAAGAAADVLLGNGDGTFQSVLMYSSGGGLPYAVAVADLNADGRSDVAIVNCNDWTVGVLINDATSQAPTHTSVLSSINPSVVGQGVTFTATVTSSRGIPPNGETIAFYNGSTVMGTAALSGGAAALTNPAFPAGVFTIKASYPGDGNLAPSASPGLKQVVNSTTKSATTTTLASSLNPSTYGQKIIFATMVTTAGPVPPTGLVYFTWASGLRTFTIGSATLNSSGVATLTKSNLNADLYPLTAVYRGDTNNLGSTSMSLNQTVSQTTSAAKISSSLNPSAQGQAVTFTLKVTSPTVTPTGPVTFKAGTTVSGTVQLSGGKATFTTSSLHAGSIVVKVTFRGNSNIKGSSASVTQAVQP